jgi:hypothetical protein
LRDFIYRLLRCCFPIPGSPIHILKSVVGRTLFYHPSGQPVRTGQAAGLYEGEEPHTTVFTLIDNGDLDVFDTIAAASGLGAHPTFTRAFGDNFIYFPETLDLRP